MNYFIIFFLKILENSLATLRLILVSNGKKWFGAILLFITSILWIISSHIAIIDINLIMIFIFSFGSLTGSYIGSIIEEKLAIGNNMVICISNKNISSYLREFGYIITETKGNGKSSEKQILLIMIKRNQNKELIKNITNLDKNAIIVSEYVNILHTK